MSQRHAEGGCLCGKLRFRAKGAPLFTMACHCPGCQRMSASAFSLSTCYMADQVDQLGAAPIVGGLHGEHRQLHCPNCLAWVYTEPHGVGPIINIRTTMFDTVAPDPPYLETYTSTALPWVKTGAAHSYPQFPPMEAYAQIMAGFAGRHAEV
jgi:hypothetical protein